MSAGLAEPHEKLASSRYAMVVVGLTVFLLAGSLALDRGAIAVKETRLELIARRNHANDMLARLDLLEKADLLPLVQLIIEAWEAPNMGAREVQKFDDGAYVIQRVVSDVPTGLMHTPRGKERNGLWKENLYRRADGDDQRPEMEGKDEVAVALPIANDLRTSILQGADAETLDRAFNKYVVDTFGPNASWAKDDTDRLRAAAGLYSGCMTEESAGWVVSGQFTGLEPDREWREEYGQHSGYPNPPKAAADQPVFSAASFVGNSPDTVRSQLVAYRTDLEKALLQQKVEISSANVAGVGISLQLADLVGLAGPLLALAQVLYVITLAQEHEWADSPYGAVANNPETNRAETEEESKALLRTEPRYPQFPRFSAPVDLRGRLSESTFEKGLERALYGAFLVVPVIVLLLCWLFEYRFTYLGTLATPLFNVLGRTWWGNPFWTDLAGNWHRGENNTFLATLNLWAFAVSLYVTHRALLVGSEERYKARFSRWRAIWWACVITGAIAYWFLCRGNREVALAAPVWFCVGLIGLAFTTLGTKWRWFLAGASVVLFMYEAIPIARSFARSHDQAWALPDISRTFVVVRELFPIDGSVLWPVFFVAVATAAAIRRKQPFTLRFFGILSALLLVLILL